MFKYGIASAACALFGAVEAKITGSELHFVQEVVRHGARAPSSSSTGFEVFAGELTASGMRQRYLLGHFNRERYVNKYEFLNYKEELYVQTTSYDRTFQSGFSELMGLFPPGTLSADELLSEAQLSGLETESRGMPPMSIRNAQSINLDLGTNPLPNGFVSIPIFNFNNKPMLDDINYTGCSYVNAIDSYNFPNDATYDSVDYLLDDLRAPISEAFGLSAAEEASMDFLGLYDWCDVVQSREFEGVSLNYTYSDSQLSEINQTVLATLTLPMATPILCN